MSAQRYTHPEALALMGVGLCPECGMPPAEHCAERRFWVRDPSGCSLLPQGVEDRLEQYRADVAAAS